MGEDRLRTTLLSVILLLFAVTCLRGATIYLTADTEGHLAPCAACPETGEVGGLARRGTLLAALTRGDDDALIVDAGNALYGAQTIAVGGRALAQAYEALGYDVVNVSYRDFRLGKRATLDAFAGVGYRVISANLFDGETSNTLFEPFVVERIDGVDWAIIGLTERPVALESLPHLARQLQGVRVEDPLATLSRVLPVAKQQADRILLLFYGSRSASVDVLAVAAGAVDAVLFGGLGPGRAPSIDGVVTATAKPHGRAVTRVSLAGDGDAASDAAAARERVESVPVGPDLEEAPAVLAVLASDGGSDSASGAAGGSGVTANDSADGAPRVLPAAVEPGTRYDLSLHGENRGLRLDVLSASFERRQGADASNEASTFLELDTMWECQVAFDLVLDLDYAEAVQVASLARQCFLVVDGRRTVRVVKLSTRQPGQLPDAFVLGESGALAPGSIAFALSGVGFESLELRFYDPQYAPIVIPFATDRDEESPASPLVAAQRNSLVELAVYGFEGRESLVGERAPRGKTFALVDVRGRSLLTRSVDARALDENAEVGAKSTNGVVFEYLRAAETLYLLVDGEYACPLDADRSSLTGVPAFLPDVTAGGTAVFAVPEGARTIELVCEFAAMQLTTGEELGIAEPLRFELLGDARPPAERTAIAAIADRPVSVGLIGVAVADEFAGTNAEPGIRFAILDIAVKHEGGEQGLYGTAERFRLDAGGGPLAVHEVTYDGPRGPARRPLWISPGARRSFQLVFVVPAAAGAARLDYSGVEVAAAIEIDLDQETVVGERAAAAAAGAATNVDEPEAPGEPRADPSPAGAISPPRVPQGLAGVGLTAKAVNDAIDRGREFLWNYIRDTDLEGDLSRFPMHNTHTIGALALVHSGAHAVYPEFDLVLRGWLGGVPGSRDAPPNADRRGLYALGRTYEASVYCLAVDAYGDPLYFPGLAAMARSLVNGQFANGSWSYSIPRELEGARDEALGEPLTVVDESTESLELERSAELEEKNGDNSATQFALLGLRAAHRRGSSAPDETWQRALKLYSERQNEDGGWSYTTGASYGSMTCAGVCSVLLSQWALGKEDPHVHPAIPAGLSWLDQQFTVRNNPKLNSHLFYYLYSLERVGRLFDTEFIGENEWYPLGAKALLDMQQADGGWVEETQRVVPTSFALLFLTRATETLVERPPEGPGAVRVTVRPQPDSRLYVILDASGSMLGRIDGREKFDVAQDCLRELAAVLPGTQEVALRVYGHRKSSLEKDADKDTALELPMKAWTEAHRKQFEDIVGSLEPRGKTPLTLSIEEATRDLSGLPGRARNTVVLLTDGGEDTGAEMDPVAAAAELARRRNTELVVVGFDIDDRVASIQLRRIAEAAGGSYWPVGRADALRAALQAAARQAPATYRIEDASGTTVAEVAMGDSSTLDPGAYSVHVPFGGSDLSRDVQILPGRKTTVLFDPFAANPTGRATSTAPPATNAVRFCTQCGTRAAPGARFCTECGRPLAR